MRPRKLAIAASLLIALMIAGCGGGDETETTASEKAEAKPTVAKAELISQGDAICAEVNAAVASVGSSSAASQTQATQVASLYENMVGSLLQLGRPTEAEGYSEFIQAAEQLAKVEGEVKLAAEREDAEALEGASGRASTALEEFQGQAAIYGFEQCSQGPGIPAPITEGGSEEGGVEVAPEGEVEVAPEEVAPEEAAPETGGAGEEEAAPEGGGESGGIGPG